MSSNSHKAAFLKLLDYARRGESFRPGKDTGGGQSTEWSGVTFRLGDTRLACDIERIHEILPPPNPTPVPGAKPWILGLANVRGGLMTIVDLAWFLTGVQTPQTTRTRLLATTLHKAPLGLLIDEVFGQRHFLDGDATAADLPADSPLSGLIQKQHRTGNEQWHELELDRLFGSQEFLNGAAY